MALGDTNRQLSLFGVLSLFFSAQQDRQQTDSSSSNEQLKQGRQSSRLHLPATQVIVGVGEPTEKGFEKRLPQFKSASFVQRAGLKGFAGRLSQLLTNTLLFNKRGLCSSAIARNGSLWATLCKRRTCGSGFGALNQVHSARCRSTCTRRENEEVWLPRCQRSVRS